MLKMPVEVNFDGLVGPTHNYAGLSYGNVASQSNRSSISRPREAALQGLKKMKFLKDQGLAQGLIPPQYRPDLEVLRAWGFRGKESEIISQAARLDPILLAICSSASCMWTANAATVAPSSDTSDGKVHFTPANLLSNPHRAIEPAMTSKLLRAIFKNDRHFVHHEPLCGGDAFSDEGAANHTRFHEKNKTSGVHLFVFGRHGLDKSQPRPVKYPARQTLEACRSIARLHGLSEQQVVYAQQNPEVIDQGVFHNDVISVGSRDVFLCHEKAFLNQKEVLEDLNRRLNGNLNILMAKTSDLSVEDAVKSYLFNSQLIALPSGEILLLAPQECEQNARAKAFIDSQIELKKGLSRVAYLDVRQSMRNGGGPACLRLRVALTLEELSAVHPQCLMTDELYLKLSAWVEKHYREEIQPGDLADPLLLEESRAALDSLTQILKLGSIYPFQK